MKRLHSIKTKQLVLLFSMILIIIICATFFFQGMLEVAVDAIYGQMATQAEYYVGTVDYQIQSIFRQQAEVFSDRKMAFLVDRDLLENDYDRREALLAVEDRLFSLKTSNNLILKTTLYIPSSDYVITDSKAKEFSEENKERLALLKGHIGKLWNDGENLVYTLCESGYTLVKEPNFYLEVVLNKQQLVENLNTFASEGGGAFLLDRDQDFFLEDTCGSSKGRAVAGKAKMWGETVSLTQESPIENGMSQVSVEEEPYLVNVCKSQYLGMLVQYYPKNTVLQRTNRYTVLFVLFVLGAAGLALSFSSYTERMVNKPLKKLQQAFKVLEQGNMDIHISHSEQDEFGYIYEGFNRMTNELKRLIEEVYIQKDLAQRAELKQLQAQINPHFLYNSFFLLSRRMKRGDQENAVQLANYLGTYFQYLTRNAADEVLLEDEVNHAECYARIQAARFVARMRVELEPLPMDVKKLLVPRLVLQPVLENAFEHGLEDTEEDGILRLFYVFDKEEHSLEIHVENNGELDKDQLEKMQERLSEGYRGEITGLVNIHRRLKNYFKGQGGVRIKRGELGGVEGILFLPMK